MKITKEDRIYGLSLVWRDVRYNFTRWDEHADLDWDAAYRDFLPLVIAEKNAFAHYELLQRFVNPLRDGHTYVVMPNELDRYHHMPFSTSYRWGRHIVNAVPTDCKVEPYSEILAINGKPLREYLANEVYPYVWHEKEDSAFRGGKLWYYIGLREGSEIEITTEDGVFSFVKDVQGNYVFPEQSHPEFNRAEVLFKSDCCSMRRTKDNIAILKYWSCSDVSFKQTLYNNVEKYRNCTGFIIDIRDNDGGSSRNTEPLTQLFFDGAFPEPPCDTPLYPASYGAYGMYRNLDALDLENPWERRIYEVGKRKLYEREAEFRQVKDCPAFLKQPIVVLTGCITASAAESLVCDLKYQNRAVTIGESTFGSNGQPFMNGLPGGGYYGICTHKCYTHDGFDYNNVGIKPDIFAENSREDMLRGYDRVLGVGLETLRGMIS